MEENQNQFTWPVAFLWIGGAQILGLLIGIVLASESIFLAPPVMAATPQFYLSIAMAPPTIALIVCLLKRPLGRVIWAALAILLGTVLVCSYLVLIGPAIGYNAVKCQAPERRGSLVRQECVCQVHMDSGVHLATCTLEGPAFLPFRRMTGPAGR
jgi:hypothetical protein